jgi:hypothetical protein
MSKTRRIGIAAALVMGGAVCGAVAADGTAGATKAAAVSPAPQASAAAAAPAAKAPANEKSVMQELSKQGFIDFNAYRKTAGGGARIQALKAKSGQLETVSIGPKGKVSTADGWMLTQQQGAKSASG